MKNKYVLFGLFLVLVLAFWNLFDYLYLMLITHSEYKFGIISDLLIPLVVAVVMGTILFLRKKNTGDS